MVWSIEFDARAEKELRKLNRQDAARIFKLLDEVAELEDPRSRGHSLVGQLSGLWRYRAGDWRVICNIEDERVTVLVLKIGHRREVYD